MVGSSEQRAYLPSPWQHEEHVLCTRVRAEFREMPGLKLTLSQAARLFHIEAATCERILGALVRAGDLAMEGNAFASPLAGRRYA